MIINWVIKKNIPSQNKYTLFTRRKSWLNSIPKHPERHYKNNGWISWGHYLGTGKVADQLKEFRLFKDARSFVHSLKLRDQKAWQKYSASGKRPTDIPAQPSTCKAYKKEWKGWRDWLGDTL